MMRLRNITSGVVVSVSDETATLLGPEWAPVSDEKPRASRTRKDPES